MTHDLRDVSGSSVKETSSVTRTKGGQTKY